MAQPNKHDVAMSDVAGNGMIDVSGQGASVTAPSGGATQDAEARTAINDIISRLEAHGLIADN
jgi:hypothetical protein